MTTSNINPDKFKIFSGSALKLIAIITMLIDHAALIIFSQLDWATAPFLLIGEGVSVYYLLRKIGRLAFPLFCFLITEGFLHTRNRKQYGLSLLVFAVVSEIPWNLMVSGKVLYTGAQNIYFTLLLGFLLLCIFEKLNSQLLQAVCLVGLYILATLLKSDYGFRGVLLIGIIYMLRQHKAAQALFAYPLLSGGVAALCAFIPINLYNGKRGFIQGKVLKYAFYAFYPLHIVVLLLIKQIVL